MHVIAAVADAYGGPARVVRQMCRELALRGHEVELFTTDAAFGERLDVPLGRSVATDGYTTWYAPCRIPRNPHVAPELVLQVARRAPDFDIAHVHGLFNFPSTFGQLALRFRRAKYVVRPCGSLNRYGMAQNAMKKRVVLAALERGNLESAAAIQASTVPERDDLRALGLERVEVVPQGVDVQRTASSSDGDPPLSAPYVLFIGRIAEVKALPRLVRAFARLTDLPELKLVIAGPDEYGHRAAVEAAANEAGLAQRVVFPGLVAGQDKARYLAHARAFALTSDSESFGIAAVEAAAFEIPLVVTTGVGIADDVVRFRAGYVAEPNEDSIAQGLREVLQARAAYVEGAGKLGMHFAWSETTGQLEDLYERARGEVAA